MACRGYAEPIFNLIEELGDTDEARELVLNNLIKYLSGKTIEEFVEKFRQDYDMNDDETEDFETNDYVMCMSCQATHHEDEDHTCDDQETHYFSSKIPAC